MKKVFEILSLFCTFAIGMCIGGALENSTILIPCIMVSILAIICKILLTIAIWQKDKTEYYCFNSGEIVKGKLNVIKTILINLIKFKTWTPNWGRYLREGDVVI